MNDTPDANSNLYNARSELISATAAVNAAYRYGYDFDDIGNRRSSAECGVQSAEYISNELNQYTNIVYSAVSPATRHLSPTYDPDGNQTLVRTATGIWSVTYNGENRPILWTQGTNTISMSFDRMGRRVTKNDRRFVYNGYLQIANFHSTTTTFDYNYFVWDPTEPVATHPLAWNRSALGTQHSTLFYTHDGNKNVSEVVASNNNVAAHYEYAPFGALTVSSGVSAAANPWRFSSEYAEDDTATVYYNYRHYEPVTGRWLERDPIGEEDSSNLFVFANNSAVGDSDVLGMFDDKFVCVKSHYEYKVVMEAPGRKRRTRVKVCDQYVVVDSEFPGHSKFSNNGTKCPFDYTLEDRSWWSRPENLITGTWRHFRAKDKIAGDLDDAIKKCDAMKFQRYMHQYQDTFVHSDKGYSWPWTLGHLPDSLRGKIQIMIKQHGSVLMRQPKDS